MNEYAIRILVTQMYIDAELVNGESRVRQLQSAIDILQGEVIAEGKVKIKDKVPCWYVGDSEVLNLIRGVVHKYEGKTIQIIIREVGN
jgi:hypothetical protein